MAFPRTGRFPNTSLKWLASFLLVLLSALCGVYLFAPAIYARNLLNQLEALQVGHSSRDYAERLAKKLGAKQDDSCDRSYCYWSVTTDNTHLPLWWRKEGVTFAIGFEVNGSVVTYKGAGYRIGINPSGFTPSLVSAGVKDKWIYIRPHPNQRVVEERPTAAGWQVSYFEKNGSRTVATEKFSVQMTSLSPPEDWKRFTAFNYACLWKYRSCKDARELLPIAASYPMHPFVAD